MWAPLRRLGRLWWGSSGAEGEGAMRIIVRGWLLWRGLSALLKKAIQSFRLRLHSGLRQRGTHLSDDEAVAKMGHPIPWLAGLVAAEGGADFFDVGAVGADGCVELVACHTKFFRPVGDVGGHFGVDLFRVVRALGGVVLVDGVGFVGFGCVVMFGHGWSSFRVLLLRWMRMGVVGMAGSGSGSGVNIRF